MAKGTRAQIRAAEGLAKRVSGMLTDRARFAPFDGPKDAEIKAAIRLYVETWLVPTADALAESLRTGSDAPLSREGW